jgi:hypothetical protein
LKWIEREVLQAIAQAGNNATALQICESLKRKTGKDHPLAKICNALNKMETRGLLSSEFTPQRYASLAQDGKALLKPDGTRAGGHAKYILRTGWFIAIVLVVVGSLLPGDSLPIETLDRLPIGDKIELLRPMCFWPSSRRFMNAGDSSLPPLLVPWRLE